MPPLDSGTAFAQLLNCRGKQESQGLAPAPQHVGSLSLAQASPWVFS